MVDTVTKLMDHMHACDSPGHVDSYITTAILHALYASTHCMGALALYAHSVHECSIRFHPFRPTFNFARFCLMLFFHIDYTSTCVYWLCQECIISKNGSITHSVLLAIFTYR